MRTQPRIVINLVFFALLGVVLMLWAVNSIVRIDALERPFHVTAEFADSPGLNPDLEVTHRGVRVGTVGDVKLRTGRVEVRLDLDRGVQVPADVGAKVLRKSAVGEPYIELTPGPGRAAALKPGDHIPVARTVGSPQYKELFDGLGRTLEAVRPEDAQTLVHELATGLEGRGQSIHDLIGDADQLTATIAANAGMLDELSVELTRTTRTLSDHRGQLASGVNDLALVTAALRNSRKDLDAVLAQGPAFLASVNRLLETSRPGLGCLLTAAGANTKPIFTPENRRQLGQVLRRVPTFQDLVKDTGVRDSQGHTYLRLKAVLTIAGPNDSAAEFDKPTPEPVPLEFRQCVATPAGNGTAPPAKAVAKAQATRPPSAGRPDIELAPVSGYTPERSMTERLLPLLPMILSGVVLVVAVAHALRVARRRAKILH